MTMIGRIISKNSYQNRVGFQAGRAGASSRTSSRSLFLSLALALALVIAPASAMAETSSGEMAKEAGMGVGSAFATLIYAPLKLAYAAGGLVVGGLAWAFSGGDANVAAIILTPSLLGDYVVTTRQLTGQQEIEFIGRKPEYRPETNWGDSSTTGDVAARSSSW